MLSERFLLLDILEKVLHQILKKVQSMIWKITLMFYEACDISNPVTTV